MTFRASYLVRGLGSLWLCVALLLSACGGADSDRASGASGKIRAQAATVGEATAVQLEVTAVEKVGERRVSRTAFEYDFQVTVSNRGDALAGVTATLAAVGQGTTVSMGTVNVGDMPAATARTGVVVVRHDRGFLFDSSAWRWAFIATPAVAPISAELTYRRSGFIARIGSPATFDLKLRLVDQRNVVTSYQVSNSTPGGAQPTIDATGKLTFTPNEADFATRDLTVTVQLQEGGGKALVVPVNVQRESAVATLAMQPDQTRYSDPRGGYVIDVGTFDGTPPSGSVQLVERRDVSGVVNYAAQVSNSNLWVKFVQAPVYGDARATAASASRRKALRVRALADDPETPQAGLQALDGADAGRLLRVATTGSVLEMGSNLWTTRRGVQFPRPKFLEGDKFEYTVARQRTVIQVDASCSREGTTGDDLCGGRSGAPFILIHGFTSEGLFDSFGVGKSPFGGGEGTWGTMAKRLMGKGDRHVFEFRWVTHMRFEEAAGQFARMVQRVAEVTGKRPVIFAGSFGGLVARVALAGQGVTWNESEGSWVQVPAPTDVGRLITFGTPHSGIHDMTGGKSVQVGRSADGTPMMRDFVYGRHNPDSEINVCESVTCIQAGAADAYEDNAANAGFDKRGHHYDILLHWVLGADVGGEHYDLLERRANEGKLGHIFPGETIHRLDSVPVPKDMVAVVGVLPGHPVANLRITKPEYIGDRLVSYAGQMVSGHGLSLDEPLRAEIDNSAPGSDNNFKQSDSGELKYFLLRNGGHTTVHGAFDYHYPFAYHYPIAEAYYEGKLSTYCQGFLFNGSQCLATFQTKSHHETLIDRVLDGVGAASGTGSVGVPITGITGRFTNRSTGEAIAGLPLEVSIVRKSDNRNLGTVSGVSLSLGFSIDVGHLIPEAQWGAAFDPGAYRAVLRWGDNATWNMGSMEIASLTSGSLSGVGDVPVDPNSPFASASLRGVISESQSLSIPVPGATIVLKRGIDLSALELLATAWPSSTSRRVQADASGAFSIAGLEPGDYSVLVTMDGFVSSLTGRLNLVGGETFQTLVLSRLQSGTTLLVDEFNGVAIDPSKWSSVGPVTVGGGTAFFASSTRISTRGKVALSGSKLVIEVRMVGGPSSDAWIYLVDENGVDIGYPGRNLFILGDTGYWGGMYLQAHGDYAAPAAYLHQVATPASSVMMEYRLTLDGDQITAERGPSLSNITQRLTMTASRSVAGRRFFLMMGTGVGWAPATFDWVRVTTSGQ